MKAKLLVYGKQIELNKISVNTVTIIGIVVVAV